MMRRRESATLNMFQNSYMGEKKENYASPGWARTTDGDADKYEIKFSVKINHYKKHWQKNKIKMLLKMSSFSNV